MRATVCLLLCWNSSRLLRLLV